MQAAEAITLLIERADQQMKTCRELRANPDYQEGTSAAQWVQDVEQTELAISIAQAMLNSMIPVARFRAFVRVESGPMKGSEFTICCTDIASVKASLMRFRSPTTKLYIQLWEQRATGADMLLGFQGSTGTLSQGKRALDRWLSSLDQFETSTSVN